MKRSNLIKTRTAGALLLLPFAICAILFISPAVAQESDEEESPVISKVKEKAWSYTVGPEDVLTISVWKNPDLSGEVIVRPDGMITLPLVGDITAGGKTPDELRGIIKSKLLEFQRTVVVSLIVREVNSYRVFILGEVGAPGAYTLRRNTSLIQAIALAGGFTEFAAKNKVVLIREKKKGAEGQKKIGIRFNDIVDEDEAKDQNLALRPGDTIFVP